MIRIIYAVPENHETVHRIVQTKANKDVIFDLVEKVDIQGLLGSDFENNIIIARGISYTTLSKKLKYARAIELAMTGYDIMRGIEECKEKYKAKKIAVMLSESIVVEKEFIEKTMDVKLEVVGVKDHAHVAEVINIAKRMEVDAILGGLTVFRQSNQEGINCVKITVGYESHKIAIFEAFSVANAIIEERKKGELFKIILENTNDGILAVDSIGVITAYNQAVFKILNVPPKTILIGNNLFSVFPELNEVHLLSSEDKEVNLLKNINNKMMVINTKPIKVNNKILGTVLLIQNVDRLQKNEIEIRQKLSKKGLLAKYDFEDIIGNSDQIKKTIVIAQKYASANANVLIIGETGTGKELFAQSIHKKSRRQNQPFVAINCAALPEQLLESELFGYVEGAFTGATKGGKVGLFEMAHRGTLFLDEIAELPLGLQAKLLRVLQEQEIRKLGDDKIIPVDVRIIAASNVDLQQKVEDNKFRQDLLYRLDILRLHIPPLRYRKNDIKEITKFFLSEFEDKDHIHIDMTDEAIIELIKHDWPGNIRELRNICERLIVLSMDGQITGQEVKEIFQILPPNQKKLSGNIYEDEKNIKKMTQKEKAEMLGVSRTTLWRKSKQK
ncbi:MAG: ArsR family transcriptional regulator [Gracilibacter sp. BRH_c7a]|nr:MAG: ArsR family transcriptional regulator [Gracilibacter sp. BRH_c7a]